MPYKIDNSNSEYVILTEDLEVPIDIKIETAMKDPKVGAVFCELNGQFFPYFHQQLQTVFHPTVIAIRKDIFQEIDKNVSLYEMLVYAYNKLYIVRRI